MTSALDCGWVLNASPTPRLTSSPHHIIIRNGPSQATKHVENLSALNVRRLFLILVPLAILITGCMSEEDQLVGKWRGKVELGSVLKGSSMGAMAGNYANMIEPQLDLKPDKTFVLSLSMAPIAGTWAYKNQEIILTPKSVMGMPANEARKEAAKAMDHAPSGFSMPFGANMLPDTKEMKVEVLNKGQKLTLDPASGTIFGGFGKMTFTKV